MQARRLGHHSDMLYNTLGFSLRRLGWLHQAERCYRLSLLLEPDAPALNNLAEIMIAQGQYGQAVPLLEQSLLIEETVEAYNNLGLCRWEEGRTDAALALYRRALKMLYGHGDPQAEHVVLSNMANVLYEKQDIASAERQTRLVLELQRELGVK
jgi:tetratricopeptide (TPR) repeat protein